MKIEVGKMYVPVGNADREYVLIEETTDTGFLGTVYYYGGDTFGGVAYDHRGVCHYNDALTLVSEYGVPTPCVAHAECDEQMQTVDVQALALEAGEKIEELLVTSAYKAAVDEVNRPGHYLSGDIECIDAIRAALTPEEFRGYCKGNMLKYIWRERHKQGDVSIEKAIWYGDELLGKAHD